MLTGCTPWPDDLAAVYREQGYWRGVPLGEIGRDTARSDPQRVAVVAGAQRVDYRSLDERADRYAAGLLARGLVPGDRVVLQAPNTPAFVELLLGCLRAGVVPALALAAHGPGDVAALVHDSGARAYLVPDPLTWTDTAAHVAAVRHDAPGLEFVVGDAAGGVPGLLTTAELARPVTTPLPSVDPSEVAFFFLSGGTTGRPKLIPRTHDDYRHQLLASAREVGLDAAGAYGAVLPAAHDAALGCPGVLGALAVGAKVVLCRTPSPDEVFDAFVDEGVTVTTVMPSILKLWTELAEDFDARLGAVHIEVGGARSEPDLIRTAGPALGGAGVSHWFGMAEGLLCFTRPGDDVELAATTQGTPLNEHDELRVVDESGADVAPGGTGELLCRGPSVLRGYYGVPEHNAVNFTADGFLRTGDLVRLDPAGRLIVTGRIKAVVNRGGEKVSAEEIESHLAAHPDIASVAVVALPDERLGERVCAVVVPRGAAPALGELREHLRGLGLAEFKLPERLAVLDTLPLTDVGKVDKRRLVGEIADERIALVSAGTERG